jgi:hypothetical protein
VLTAVDETKGEWSEEEDGPGEYHCEMCEIKSESDLKQR